MSWLAHSVMSANEAAMKKQEGYFPLGANPECHMRAWKLLEIWFFHARRSHASKEQKDADERPDHRIPQSTPGAEAA